MGRSYFHNMLGPTLIAGTIPAWLPNDAQGFNTKSPYQTNTNRPGGTSVAANAGRIQKKGSVGGHFARGSNDDYYGAWSNADDTVFFSRNTETSFPETVYVGGYFFTTNGASGIQTIISLQTSSSNLLVLTFTPSTDALSVTLNGSAVSGSPFSVTQDTSDVIWFNIHMYQHGSAGTLKIRANNTDLCNLTGLNTLSSGNRASRFHVRSSSTSTAALIKDLIIADGTIAPFQDTTAPMTVTCDSPTSIISGGWSNSTGSDNLALIDETSADIVDYIYSDTAGTEVVFGFDAWEGNTPYIVGVEVFGWARSANDPVDVTMANGVIQATEQFVFSNSSTNAQAFAISRMFQGFDDDFADLTFKLAVPAGETSPNISSIKRYIVSLA